MMKISMRLSDYKKGNTVYRIYPTKQKKDYTPESNITIIADENLNIGRLKYASLKTKFGGDDLASILAMAIATILCLLVIYWAIVTMILGGRIFFGGLVVTAVVVLWKFLFSFIAIIFGAIKLFLQQIKSKTLH